MKIRSDEIDASKYKVCANCKYCMELNNVTCLCTSWATHINWHRKICDDFEEKSDGYYHYNEEKDCYEA